MDEVYTERVNCEIPFCMAIAEYEIKNVILCFYHYNMLFVKGDIQK